MSIDAQRYWTRKDVATMLEVSVDTVARNEQHLGLDVARRDLNQRTVRYVASIASRELKSRGQIPK